jgi:hypothetical protein
VKIYTTKGLVEFDQLTVADVVTMEENARVIATEWRLGEELVRRDVYVNMLRQLEMGAEQGGLNG